jgi:hypothetical protein
MRHNQPLNFTLFSPLFLKCAEKNLQSKKHYFFSLHPRHSFITRAAFANIPPAAGVFKAFLFAIRLQRFVFQVAENPSLSCS